MLKLSLLIASAAAFQPRSTPKVQPKTVQQFGMLDGLFKKSEADVTETVCDISMSAAPHRPLRRHGINRRCCTPSTQRACSTASTG